jgi:hypothetical protein
MAVSAGSQKVIDTRGRGGVDSDPRNDQAVATSAAIKPARRAEMADLRWLDNLELLAERRGIIYGTRVA